jgi:hypothetical protein
VPVAPGVASVTTAAGQAIDPARCSDSKARLRPFAIDWDATEQAEFSGHTKQSLAVVKVAGCSLELLTQCKIPGEYRVTETAGNMESLSLANDDQLYLEVPLSVASLSGHLKQSGSLKLTYYVRGIGYATAPGLYRSQLGSGCEGATHLVINYAIGAYELGATSGSSAGGGARAFGAGAGAESSRSADALFRGGDMTGCDHPSPRCDAPVRLRLVPIAAGDPPEADKAAAALATTRPQIATGSKVHLTPEEVQAGVRAMFPALKACYNAALARSVTEGKLVANFTIAEDGTVQRVVLTTEAKFDKSFLDCAEAAFHSLRFPSAAKATSIVYPIIFKAED